VREVKGVAIRRPAGGDQQNFCLERFPFSLRTSDLHQYPPVAGALDCLDARFQADINSPAE
jgi:hypothetical protein